MRNQGVRWELVKLSQMESRTVAVSIGLHHASTARLSRVQQGADVCTGYAGDCSFAFALVFVDGAFGEVLLDCAFAAGDATEGPSPPPPQAASRSEPATRAAPVSIALDVKGERKERRELVIRLRKGFIDLALEGAFIRTNVRG